MLVGRGEWNGHGQSWARAHAVPMPINEGMGTVPMPML
jgi:hypothetical protein